MTIMDLIRKKIQLLSRYGNYGAWTIALVGMLGSLYLSDIVGWIPCILCWYSRILMYPIVVIGAVGILRKDHNWSLYALPLSIGGVVLSLYHSLLQWGIIPEAIAPCRSGISCATKQLNLLGFITIPFLALLAFVAITVCLYFYWKENKNVERS